MSQSSGAFLSARLPESEDRSPTHRKKNEEGGDHNPLKLAERFLRTDKPPTHRERLKAVGEVKGDAERSQNVNKECRPVVVHFVRDVGERFGAPRGHPRVEHCEPNVRAEKEQKTDRAEALKGILKVCVKPVSNVVGSSHEHTTEPPHGVKGDRQESDQAGEQLREGVRILGDRLLPRICPLESGEVGPEVPRGPHAEGKNREERSEACAEKSGTGGGDSSGSGIRHNGIVVRPGVGL